MNSELIAVHSRDGHCHHVAADQIDGFVVDYSGATVAKVLLRNQRPVPVAQQEVTRLVSQLYPKSGIA